jgi:hypothetical protein
MKSPRQLDPLTVSFLQHLDTEEGLLQESHSLAASLYDTLRQGQLATIKELQPRLAQLAVSLRATASKRETDGRDLCLVLNIPPEQFTLSKLAERIGEPHASRLLAARERLDQLTTQIADLQHRNANLIQHLRSYFRSVLSALTKTTDYPIRYGASGTCLNPGFGAAIQARG